MKFLSKISNEVIHCNEMTVGDYREMLKCSFGEVVDQDLFIENFINILSKIIGKDISYIRKLNILDIVYLLLDIYSNSIGKCKIVVTHQKKTLNVELNLNTIKQSLYNCNHLFAHMVDVGSYKIIMQVPTIERSVQPAKYLFLTHIKGIQQQETYIPIETNEYAAKLVEMLPLSVVNKIIAKYDDTNKVLSKINFLSPYGLADINFTFFPTYDNFLWLVKLFFGDGLPEFYHNFFHLVRTGNMQANFVEQMSVGEFNYFIGLLSQVLADTSENTTNNIQHEVGLTNF